MVFGILLLFGIVVNKIAGAFERNFHGKVVDKSTTTAENFRKSRLAAVCKSTHRFSKLCKDFMLDA
jgi:hypothetical protein